MAVSRYSTLTGYEKFYAWATWATFEQSVDGEPLEWWKILARRVLAKPTGA